MFDVRQGVIVLEEGVQVKSGTRLEGPLFVGPGTQVYEAWLIGANQVPVAIGGFKVDRSGTASFVTPHPAIGEGVVVALTLEAQPGATTPTPPILAVGTAHAQSS